MSSQNVSLCFHKRSRAFYLLEKFLSKTKPPSFLQWQFAGWQEKLSKLDFENVSQNVWFRDATIYYLIQFKSIPIMLPPNIFVCSLKRLDRLTHNSWHLGLEMGGVFLVLFWFVCFSLFVCLMNLNILCLPRHLKKTQYILGVFANPN